MPAASVGFAGTRIAVVSDLHGKEFGEDNERLLDYIRDLEPDCIAVVGDLYTKYCRLGNWDLEQFLERHGCEMAVNGITWHFLYYLDTHLTGPRRRAAKPLLRHIRGLQAGLCRILAEAGFAVLPPYRELKALAAEYSCTGSSLGSGWLLAGEAAGWVRAGYRKVLATLPFGPVRGAPAQTPRQPHRGGGLRRLAAGGHRGEPHPDAAGHGAAAGGLPVNCTTRGPPLQAAPAVCELFSEIPVFLCNRWAFVVCYQRLLISPNGKGCFIE